MSGTPLVGWLLVGMGSRKGLSTLDDTLGLTGKLSRFDRNKQPPQNCRAGQGDILVRGSGTAASRSFMHCQKYRCSRSPPRNQLRTWHRRPLLLPPAPKLLSQPCNVHAMTLQVRSGSWRRPRSNDSPSCLALRARRQTRQRPLRRWNAWRQSAARARHRHHPCCTASPAAQCWPGTGPPPPEAENDVAWVGSEMPHMLKTVDWPGSNESVLYTRRHLYKVSCSLSRRLYCTNLRCVLYKARGHPQRAGTRCITSSTADRGSTSPYPP